MKELIVGGGGREHALGWKLHEDNAEDQLFFAPGNARTDEIGENIPVHAEDLEGITRFAKERNIDLVIIGPDNPLSLGIVDALQQAGISVFGPTQKAARIEYSKAFAKEFMVRHGIPTARFEIFDNLMEAQKHLHQVDYPVVIKASGLAAGKGVVVPQTNHDAEDALVAMLEKHEFGQAGQTVVIEERLEGIELSAMAFTDGETVKMMPFSRDHKRLKDGDQGPNTGGMGTFAPVNIDEATKTIIEEKIIQKAIDSMASEGMPFSGAFYPGLMLTRDGPKVLEFNSRFGDPETQVILPLLETPLLEVIDAMAEGNLPGLSVRWKKQSTVCVVLAAKGYPDKPEKGEVIHGLKDIDDGQITIFHAGTKQVNGEVIVNGGRVLNVTAIDTSVLKAQRRAYSVIGLGKVYFKGMQYRRDIGNSGLR